MTSSAFVSGIHLFIFFVLILLVFTYLFIYSSAGSCSISGKLRDGGERTLIGSWNSTTCRDSAGRPLLRQPDPKMMRWITKPIPIPLCHLLLSVPFVNNYLLIPCFTYLIFLFCVFLCSNKIHPTNTIQGYYPPRGRAPSLLYVARIAARALVRAVAGRQQCTRVGTSQQFLTRQSTCYSNIFILLRPLILVVVEH